MPYSSNGRQRGGNNYQESRSSGQTSWWRAHSRALLIALVVLVLLTAGSGIDALIRYSHDRSLASDGMRHLRAAQALMPGGQIINVLIDAAVLPKVTAELSSAEQDFSALRSDLGAPGGTLFLAAHTPGIGGTISSSAMLAAAADEVCLAGLAAVRIAPSVQQYVHGGIFAKTTPTPNAPPPAPLTAATFASMSSAWATAKIHISNAIDFASHADLSVIPGSLVSGKQVAALRGLLSNRANLQKQLDQVDGWLKVAPQLLGVATPERFLLVLQDRGELRSTGGFMGNHALLTIQGGRVQPFHLEDTYLLDRPYTAQYGGFPVPTGYSWWPFSPFAFRDSNLSPDFPTSAQFEQKYYQQESGASISGIIAITPTLIESVLKVTGGVKVAGYPDFVTSTNLESTIHKYQLGVISHDPAARKAFTRALGQAVMASIQKLTLAQQAKLVSEALTLIRSRDIQIWFADPQAESLLASSGSDGSIAHGPGDAVTPVDSNIGVNKANQFVTVKYTDQVTLDAKGTATHHLAINYLFHATNLQELYGADQYHTYLRVYMPANASLSASNGFVFDYITPNYFGRAELPGHQMWAGHVIVADGQPLTVTLVWTVPKAAQRDGSGRWHYALDFQHQATSLQYLTLVVTTPDRKDPALSYKGWLSSDRTFSIAY